MLIRDEEERKKEASKVRQTKKQHISCLFNLACFSLPSSLIINVYSAYYNNIVICLCKDV